MSNLQSRQEKIQSKRKQTSWRDFVMEICSWSSIIYGKDRGLISKFPKSDRIRSVVRFVDFSDMDNTNNYEFVGKSFFGELIKLFYNTPSPNMRNIHSENSEYSDVVIHSKNAYLSNTIINGCENVLYSISVKDNSTNIINSMMVWNNCNNVFSSKTIINSFNVFYSQNIHNSSNIWFSTNLMGCHDCLLCDGLENQSYHINNKQYTKEDYYKETKKLLNNKDLFMQMYNDVLTLPTKNLICNNTTGKSNIECHNVDNGYYCYNVNNGRNLFLHGSKIGSEEAFDCYTGGSPQVNNFYGVYASGNCEHLYCCAGNDEGSSNLLYCINCDACSFCLGCIGFKNKSYCILNKQYTKEERYDKVDEIFTQMEKDGQLGEFFPATMNPFYFNDTAAYLIDPSFTKEEVTAKGYLWRDEPIKVDIPEGMEIVKTSELDKYEGWQDSQGRVILNSFQDLDAEINSAGYIWWINADILKKVIQDEEGNVYRIIPMEYKFLVKHGLPLPRKHWLERMKENFKIN